MAGRVLSAMGLHHIRPDGDIYVLARLVLPPTISAGRSLERIRAGSDRVLHERRLDDKSVKVHQHLSSTTNNRVVGPTRRGSPAIPDVIVRKLPVAAH